MASRIPISRSAFVTSAAAVAVAVTCRPVVAAANRYPTLSMLLERRAAIGFVRVYALDPDVSTLIAVTPAALERFPGVRIRTHGDRATIESTLRALVRAGAVASTEPFDARFGLVYESREGRRLFSAFTDARAVHGELGSHRVAFDAGGVLLAALRAAAR